MGTLEHHNNICNRLNNINYTEIPEYIARQSKKIPKLVTNGRCYGINSLFYKLVNKG
jgi:hypothetical protein